ncbi:MAG: hypothetical protein PHR60_01735 [Eubacteriales bacterium]|nr:hypothetical protein [Eubacteriales bacterium]MDD4582893.1 hypothetical protein [Eubacteriales bacterium]
METQYISWRKVISFAGAFIAFLIGSGFATGQEVLQYFTSYGYWGIAGGIVTMILLIYVGTDFITVGYEKRFPKPGEIFHYYCGHALGKFFDYFSILFIYMSFMVMVAGAGATLQQHYGVSVAFGGIIITVLASGTVIFGLNRIVDIIGNIGPVIVVISIALGVSAIIRNPAGIAEGNALLPTLELTRASTNWFFAAGSYVGFCMLWLAAFMAAMGATAHSKKEAALGGALGAIAFASAVIIVTLGLLINIEQVVGTQIPSLYLAQNLSPTLATGFSIIIIAGIYTTAVPLLWTVAARFTLDKSKKFRIMTVILATIGALVGLVVPFSKMVNIVYVINGYVGIILLILMVIKSIMKLKRQ